MKDKSQFASGKVVIPVIGAVLLISCVAIVIYFGDHFNTEDSDSVIENLNDIKPQIEILEEAAVDPENAPTKDSNAEMLIAIPDRTPSQYLVPPPFPPPLSVLIKRRPPPVVASRRYFEDPRPFHLSRKPMNRLPVNSIQDILNQMERESTEYERVANKKPKRINFYGRYRHRPNRPKVVPIVYGGANAISAVPVRENNPSVANDVNHLITQSPVPQHEPTQLFYPNLPTANTYESPGLYDQIIATNKHRHEMTKDAKPFSLMLDIYPMTENQTTTTFPPPLPPQLPPLQIDHSYYNSIKFPQINPTYKPPALVTGSPNEQPEKMVVHLNLYPTKKNQKSNQLFDPDPKFFVTNEEESFMPILNPQIYYRSRSAEDETNQQTIQSLRRGNVVDIPKTNIRHPSRPQGIPRIQQIESQYFGPPINITDYRTTIPPQIINKLIYEDGPPKYTYLGQFNSNEIGRRVDVQMETTSTAPVVTTKRPRNNYQRNSHQPDNPMVVENLSQYLLRSGSSSAKPSKRDTLSS